MMNDEVLSKQDGNKPIGNVTKSIDSNEVTNIEYLYRTVMKKLNDGYESGMSVATANQQANTYQRFSKENRHDSQNSPVMAKKKSTVHDSSQSFDISDIRHCKRKNIHVKSRSGDSDYLYTDFLKTSCKSSGSSSKIDIKNQQSSSHSSTRKVSTPVSRSSSFHYGNKKTPSNDLMPNAVRDFNFRNFLDEMNASQQHQHTDQQMNYRQFTQQHGVIQSTPIVDIYNLKNKSTTKDITEEGSGVQTLWSSNPTVEVDIIPTPSTPSTDMSQTPTAGNPQLNFRSQQGHNNMLQNSNNFYQIHPTQDSPNQSFNAQQQTQGSRSGHGIMYQGVPCDMSSTEFNTATTDGGALHSSTTNLPQRPKTLALGQNTRSKSDCTSSNNNNSLISPSMSLPSPSMPANHHQCTPLRNTLYYNTGVMDITPAYTPSRVQHPRQRSGGSITGGQISSQQQQQQHQQYLRRNGSAGNIVNSTSTPSAQTPNYPEYTFCETINGPIKIRTPTSHPNFNAATNQQQTNNFDQGFTLSSMSKCESNSSQRRMPNTAATNNQYRNSGSFGYSSAGSGSSSNSGSRPNSHADDFPHPLEIENESLRCQLKKVKHQLKMMQTIKKSLQLITDDYNSLHQSVSKREKLQNEVQKSLLNELDSCKKENRNLKGQLHHVQEKLIQNQMEYRNNGKNEEVQNESQKIISSYEAKNRQLEEKKRELDEELEECRKIMMEQQSEIVDLNNELSTSRESNCNLQEQLQFQTECVNAATARESKMEALQKTLQEQVYVEHKKYEELRRHHQYRQQQHQQQPSPPHNNHQVVRSVPASSNDEGASEVDHGFVETVAGAVWTPSVLTHDKYAVQDQKLKWRQVQLEEMLAFSAHTDPNHGYNSASSCSCRPGSSEDTTPVVRNQHRHAASDPCFNKLPEYKFPAGEQRESATPPLHGAIFSSLPAEASNEEENQKPIQFDFSCQTSQEFHHQQQQPPPNERSHHQIDQEQRCSPQKKNHQQSSSSSQQTTGSMTSPALSCHQQRQQQQQTRQTNTEGDSPASEGYHSQQSSGSPTPNSERSMSNFPVTGRSDHHVVDIVARNSCQKATDV